MIASTKEGQLHIEINTRMETSLAQKLFVVTSSEYIIYGDPSVPVDESVAEVGDSSFGFEVLPDHEFQIILRDGTSGVPPDAENHYKRFRSSRPPALSPSTQLFGNPLQLSHACLPKVQSTTRT